MLWIPPVTFNDDTARKGDGFLEDVWNGLAAKPKAIPSKYFYDAEGSRLFDRICALPEYYLTRTEAGILQDNATAIAESIGAGGVLVELGAGSSVKVRILLDAAVKPAAFLPVDISGAHLTASSRALAADYPDLKVIPVIADFLDLPDLDPLAPKGRRVGFFPGSTIGNLSPAQAEAFLHRLAFRLGPEAGLIIGIDLKKPSHILHGAYNDAQGVTAAFNLNLLRRINRELEGDFDLDGFRHAAFYNPARSRVEMHLQSRSRQSAQVMGRRFRFLPGETIHTENSYKYDRRDFAALAARAGWRVKRSWSDANDLFCVLSLARHAPDDT